MLAVGLRTMRRVTDRPMGRGELAAYDAALKRALDSAPPLTQAQEQRIRPRIAATPPQTVTPADLARIEAAAKRVVDAAPPLKPHQEAGIRGLVQTSRRAADDRQVEADRPAKSSP